MGKHDAWRQAEAVRRSYQNAIDDGNPAKADRIAAANPDLFAPADKVREVEVPLEDQRFELTDAGRLAADAEN